MAVRSVLVVHAERMMAEALASSLDELPAMRVVGIMPTPALAEAFPATVDAVAMWAALPGAEDAASRLRRRGPRVVLYGDGPSAAESGAAEADDEGTRVTTGAPITALAEALVPGCTRHSAPNRNPLSPREREILNLVSEGLAAKQVAGRLGISEKTVEHHKGRIFRKLDVPNQAAAVRTALALGLV